MSLENWWYKIINSISQNNWKYAYSNSLQYFLENSMMQKLGKYTILWNKNFWKCIAHTIDLIKLKKCNHYRINEWDRESLSQWELAWRKGKSIKNNPQLSPKWIGLRFMGIGTKAHLLVIFANDRVV